MIHFNNKIINNFGLCRKQSTKSGLDRDHALFYPATWMTLPLLWNPSTSQTRWSLSSRNLWGQEISSIWRMGNWSTARLSARSWAWLPLISLPGLFASSDPVYGREYPPWSSCSPFYAGRWEMSRVFILVPRAPASTVEPMWREKIAQLTSPIKQRGNWDVIVTGRQSVSPILSELPKFTL